MTKSQLHGNRTRGSTKVAIEGGMTFHIEHGQLSIQLSEEIPPTQLSPLETLKLANYLFEQYPSIRIAVQSSK